MTSPFVLVAPLALLLPLTGVNGVAPFPDNTAEHGPKKIEKVRQSEQPLAVEALATPTQRQVRIERRVIVRIAPRSSRQRTSMIAEMQDLAPEKKIVERKIGKCIPLKSIAGVQSGSGNRLILHMRNRNVVSLKLEKSCRSRDFYSGFYVEQDKDGKLCVDRDELLSRSGAKCEFKRLRQLVSIEK